MTSNAVDPETVREIIQAGLEDLVTSHQSYGDRTNPLFDASRNAMSTPGKMMRAEMSLNSCLAVGGATEDAQWAAVGAECGHLASLIQDDVMDNDRLRRGRPTVWTEYGANAAILIGDLFTIEAFYALTLCSPRVDADRIVSALRITTESCIALCLGQALEVQLLQNCAATASEYFDVIRGKTAGLFRAACQSGAVLGGAGERDERALGRFGELVGLAFQVTDDLLPYTSSGSETGKSGLSDLQNRRVTLPIIYALTRASAKDAVLIRKAFVREPGALAEDVTDHDWMRRTLDRCGAINQAHRLAGALTRQALDELDTLDASPARDALADAAQRAVRRVS
jgi:geranylgeranyl diphosphate synthase type I